MSTLNVDKMWDNLSSYPEVSESQKEKQLIYSTMKFSAATQFGTIKDTLRNMSAKQMEMCIEELHMMPLFDGDDPEEKINDEGRYYLHSNMYHEIIRITNFYNSTWHATPKKKQKSRAFF